MKTQRYQHRFYREWGKFKDLRLSHIVAKETDLHILTDKKLDEDFVKERIRAYRWEIESYIDRDRRFLVALKPIEVELSASPIVKEMSNQAKIANVGPMAAVAGAIADFLGRDLVRKGYKDVIIENGGDIFIKTRKSRLIGIYAGRSKFSQCLNLKIKPADTPLGVCASSGTIGHSLSFGLADSVIIIAKNAILADAVATATANRVKVKEDLKPAVDFARSLRGVLGVAIVLKNNLIASGEVEFAK